MKNKKLNIFLVIGFYFMGTVVQFAGFFFRVFRHQTQLSLTLMFGGLFFALFGDLFLAKLLPRRLIGLKIPVLIHAGGCAFGLVLFLLYVAGVPIPGLPA